MLLSFLLFIPIVGIFLIFGVTFYLALGKYLTKQNLITGIVCLICIFLIKQSGIALLILNLGKWFFPNITFPVHIEDLIASILGLIARLSVKGVIEEFFNTNSIPLPQGRLFMTGVGDDIDSPETGNSTGINSSGGSASKPNPSASSTSPADPSASSASNPSGDPSASSASNTSSGDPSVSQLNTSGDSTGYVKGRYVSKRYIQIFSAEAERLSSEIKELSQEIKNCNDEAERIKKEDNLDELFGMLTMLDKETAVQTRKLLSTEDSNPSDNKRAADNDSLSQNSSKKR